MPWQFADGPATQMRLLHSLAIPNGLRSREVVAQTATSGSIEFGNPSVQNQAEGVDQ
jgi:hypothetical protein